jgi:DNA oxidative demethylase
MIAVQLPIGDERVLRPGVVLLPGWAREAAPRLMKTIDSLVAHAPFRHMLTPGGHRMSVEMSNCGRLGWVSDRSGYRYDAVDPLTGRAWPAMPREWLALAHCAALRAGFGAFEPDACLINRYVPGVRLSLHQDRNERDFRAPVVSVSLGLPVTFLLGGSTRGERPARLALEHGDVLVWGGPARLAFHGTAPLRDGVHELLGPQRINLTLRRAA